MDILTCPETVNVNWSEDTHDAREPPSRIVLAAVPHRDSVPLSLSLEVRSAPRTQGLLSGFRWSVAARFWMPFSTSCSTCPWASRRSLRSGGRARWPFVAALAFGTLVSFTVEWAQLSIPGRFGNWNDLLCNSAGTLLGVALAFAATSPPLASRLRVLNSPGVLLLGLWAGLAGFHVFAPILGRAGYQPRDCWIIGAGCTGLSPPIPSGRGFAADLAGRGRTMALPISKAHLSRFGGSPSRAGLRDRSTPTTGSFSETVPLYRDPVGGTEVGYAMDLGAGCTRCDPVRRRARAALFARPHARRSPIWSCSPPAR